MMHSIKHFFETVKMGLFAVLIFPVVWVFFVGYLLYLAFWPEPKSKTVSVFDGYEGWHV